MKSLLKALRSGSFRAVAHTLRRGVAWRLRRLANRLSPPLSMPLGHAGKQDAPIAQPMQTTEHKFHSPQTPTANSTDRTEWISPHSPDSCLLHILVPAYERPKELTRAVDSLIRIFGDSREVRVTVVDDSGRSSDFMKNSWAPASVEWVGNAERLGLERNIMHATNLSTGVFTWIFGDDDYLLPTTDWPLLRRLLLDEAADLVVLNRERRKPSGELLSSNWMNLRSSPPEFDTFLDFVSRWGWISVLGFISTTIFKTKPFESSAAQGWWGLQYPQLCALTHAFSNSTISTVSDPWVVHTTPTNEEKRYEVKREHEADFFRSERHRNQQYFGHQLAHKISQLVAAGVPYELFERSHEYIWKMSTVDFLLTNLARDARSSVVNDSVWQQTVDALNALPLPNARVESVQQWDNSRGIHVLGRSLRVGVVQPSRNQAEFITTSVMSVAAQTLAPRHLVMDGKSSDETIEILCGLQVPYISKEDRGQAAAINEGAAALQDVEILTWLNTDDTYVDESCLADIQQVLRDNPSIDVVVGNSKYVSPKGDDIRPVFRHTFASEIDLLHAFQWGCGISQPAAIFRRSAWNRVGGLNEHLHYSMDYDLWIRMAKEGVRFSQIDRLIASCVLGGDTKTFGHRRDSLLEVFALMTLHFGYIHDAWLRRLAEFELLGVDGVTSVAPVDAAESVERRIAVLNAGTNDVTRHLQLGPEAPLDNPLGPPADAGIEQFSGGLQLDVLIGSDEPRTVQSAPSQGRGRSQSETRFAPLLEWTRDGSTSDNTQIRRRVGDRFVSKATNDHNLSMSEWAKWVKNEASRNAERTCVIVANGPSLLQIDLEKLKTFDVIISNNAIRDMRLRGQRTLYTVVNYLVAEQNYISINADMSVEKVFPWWLGYVLRAGERDHICEAIGLPEFSFDISANISWRHTVTFFNMQLALGLGYSRVAVIGLDNSYTQPRHVREGDVILQSAPDVNHFSHRYFEGQRWQAAGTEMMHAMYELAAVAFSASEIPLLNCTPGGNVSCLNRLPWEDL